MTTVVKVQLGGHQVEMTKRGRSDEILDIQTLKVPGREYSFYAAQGESVLVRELPDLAEVELPETSGKARRISQDEIDAASGMKG